MVPTAVQLALNTADGVALEADLQEAQPVLAAAVICHPHPRFGGNRFNAVVSSVFRALPAAGVSALRFDFRPGAGADGGDLASERLDVSAALDELHRRAPGRPLVLVGYSFGAGVALGVEHDGVVAAVGIAPPLSMVRVERPPAVPTLLLVPAHDQFGPPAVVTPLVSGWPAVTVETVAGADHFLVGHAAVVAQRVATWVVAQLAGS